MAKPRSDKKETGKFATVDDAGNEITIVEITTFYVWDGGGRTEGPKAFYTDDERLPVEKLNDDKYEILTAPHTIIVHRKRE